MCLFVFVYTNSYISFEHVSILNTNKQISIKSDTAVIPFLLVHKYCIIN